MAEGDWVLGLSASALSGLSSAYAGVYFEKYVKGKMSSTLWIRNLQLGIYGLPLSIAYMLVKDHGRLSNGGIMQVALSQACTPNPQPAFAIDLLIPKFYLTVLLPHPYLTLDLLMPEPYLTLDLLLPANPHRPLPYPSPT